MNAKQLRCDQSKPIDRIETLPPRPVDKAIRRPVLTDGGITRPTFPDVNAPKKLPPPSVNPRQFERPQATPAPTQRLQIGQTVRLPYHRRPADVQTVLASQESRQWQWPGSPALRPADG